MVNLYWGFKCMYEETNIRLIKGLKYRSYLLFKKDLYKAYTILFLVFCY